MYGSFETIHIFNLHLIFYSGGLNFKIVGYHFDSVSTYVLRTIINSSVSQDTVMAFN